jgi:hypothetical protein
MDDIVVTANYAVTDLRSSIAKDLRIVISAESVALRRGDFAWPLHAVQVADDSQMNEKQIFGHTDLQIAKFIQQSG